MLRGLWRANAMPFVDTVLADACPSKRRLRTPDCCASNHALIHWAFHQSGCTRRQRSHVMRIASSMPTATMPAAIAGVAVGMGTRGLHMH